MTDVNYIAAVLRTEGRTVRELIELLSDHDPDAVVLFTADYGDISHTMQAFPVTDVDCVGPGSELIDVVESAYSHSRMAFVKDDDELDREFDPEEFEEDDTDRVRDHVSMVVLNCSIRV